jgi:hypothetical protein
MQSHTYKFGTESFKTLSMAYKRFPFKGCCEFWTIGLIYCRIVPTKSCQNISGNFSKEKKEQEIPVSNNKQLLTCSIMNPITPINIINLTS